jgi:hypothetical protein
MAPKGLVIYISHFLMSQFSLLFGLYYFFYFTISDAVGKSDQAITGPRSLSDLPKRNLTQYVQPLMGTKAGEHSKSPVGETS